MISMTNHLWCLCSGQKCWNTNSSTKQQAYQMKTIISELNRATT